MAEMMDMFSWIASRFPKFLKVTYGQHIQHATGIMGVIWELAAKTRIKSYWADEWKRAHGWPTKESK